MEGPISSNHPLFYMLKPVDIFICPLICMIVYMEFPYGHVYSIIELLQVLYY